MKSGTFIYAPASKSADRNSLFYHLLQPFRETTPRHLVDCVLIWIACISILTAIALVVSFLDYAGARSVDDMESNLPDTFGLIGALSFGLISLPLTLLKGLFLALVDSGLNAVNHYFNIHFSAFAFMDRVMGDSLLWFSVWDFCIFVFWLCLIHITCLLVYVAMQTI